MCTPCQKTWPKLEGCEPKGEDFGEILDEKLILQTLLTSPTSPGLHLYTGHCAVHYAVYACQYVLRWLLTFMFRVPLQGIRLSTFFARLALYIIFLLPAMICGLAYWAFAGKDILSMKYKDKGSFRHTVDIYLPNSTAKARLAGKDPESPTPVLILVAGGAFILGHKGYVTMLCRALRLAGILCIAVDYRYWPQTSIDGMIDDVDSAVQWCFDNASRYGGDPKRISLLGLSSGAHVAGLLLTRRAKPGHGSARKASKSTPCTPTWSPSDLVGFIGLGGIYELHSRFMAHLHQKGIDVFLQQLVLGDTQALRESRSPSILLRRDGEIGRHLPPVLLLHGTGDKIVPPDQSEGFCQELLKSRVSVRLLFHEGQGHNDPVIHSPLMSNHETVEAIILSIHEWTSGQKLNDGRLLPDDSDNMNSIFPDSCRAQLAALPTWPRTPEPVIQIARFLTPF